jgi:PAS domain S-box-containing protein
VTPGGDVVAAIPHIVTMYDVQARCTYVSPSITKLRGLSVEEAQRESFDRVMTTDSLRNLMAVYEQMMPKVIRGENPAPRLELEQYRREGSTSWTEASINTLRDGAGRLTGFVGVSRDISERKKAEAALRESERRLADIIDFLPIATMVIDSHGITRAWNREMEKSTGVKAADMVGKGDHECAPPFYGERRSTFIDLVLTPPGGAAPRVPARQERAGDPHRGIVHPQAGHERPHPCRQRERPAQSRRESDRCDRDHPRHD